MNDELKLPLSIFSMKGMYALLVGSGTSRSAGILTGYDITLDLINKLALDNSLNISDPLKWFKDHFKKEPNYSNVIESCANTETQRSLILRTYFESNAEESKQGVKQPTECHRAIAKLVKHGYIKVIITTNFDRLLEQALADVAINPTIIRNSDDVKRSLPLTHSNCTIIKVNSDYMDTTIKNTLEELQNYDLDIVDLLKEVFTDYGLVICGWSAEYDKKLYDILMESKSLKFSTFITNMNELNDNQHEICKERNATVIDIKNADDFFGELKDNVIALETLLNKETLSPELAAQRVRDIYKDSRPDIRLNELMTKEISIFHENMREIYDLFSGPPYNEDKYIKSFLMLESKIATLESILTESVIWHKNGEFILPYGDYIVKIANPVLEQLINNRIEYLRYFIILKLLYVIAIIAVKKNELGIAFSTFNDIIGKMKNYEIGASDFSLIYKKLKDEANDKIKLLKISSDSDYPLSSYIYDNLSKRKEYVNREYEFKKLFVEFELLLFLEVTYQIWIEKKRKDRTEIYINGACVRIMHRGGCLWKEIIEKMNKDHNNNLYAKSGFFGDDEGFYSYIIDSFIEKLNERSLKYC